MEAYTITILVNSQQEDAIKDLFHSKGWTYNRNGSFSSEACRDPLKYQNHHFPVAGNNFHGSMVPHFELQSPSKPLQPVVETFETGEVKSKLAATCNLVDGTGMQGHSLVNLNETRSNSMVDKTVVDSRQTADTDNMGQTYRPYTYRADNANTSTVNAASFYSGKDRSDDVAFLQNSHSFSSALIYKKSEDAVLHNIPNMIPSNNNLEINYHPYSVTGGYPVEHGIVHNNHSTHQKHYQNNDTDLTVRLSHTDTNTGAAVNNSNTSAVNYAKVDPNTVSSYFKNLEELIESLNNLYIDRKQVQIKLKEAFEKLKYFLEEHFIHKVSSVSQEANSTVFDGGKHSSDDNNRNFKKRDGVELCNSSNKSSSHTMKVDMCDSACGNSDIADNSSSNDIFNHDSVHRKDVDRVEEENYLTLHCDSRSKARQQTKEELEDIDQNDFNKQEHKMNGKMKEAKFRWTVNRNQRMHKFHRKCESIPPDLNVKNYSDIEKGFYCIDCRFVFLSDSKFKFHKRLKGGYCSAECIYCDADNLKDVFQCLKCPKCFQTKEMLEKHEEKHVDALKCSLCPLEFYSEKSLAKHNQLQHSELPCKLHLCDLCGSKFKEKKVLNAHRRFVHSNDRPERCPQCNKCFKTKSQLKNHLVTHKTVSELDLSCEICGKMFLRVATLKDHVRRHKKEFSCFCPVCNKGFYRKHGLVEHLRIHTGDKPFDCKVCGFKCSLSCNLVKHMKIHQKYNS